MTTYLTLPTQYGGDEKNDKPTEIRYATNGAPHVRILGDRRRKTIQLLHPRLSRAQLDALMDFYDAQVGPFTYNRTRGGVAESYTVAFNGPPQERHVRGGYFDVRVTLIEA